LFWFLFRVLHTKSALISVQLTRYDVTISDYYTVSLDLKNCLGTDQPYLYLSWICCTGQHHSFFIPVLVFLCSNLLPCGSCWSLSLHTWTIVSPSSRMMAALRVFFDFLF
jgi:hypothetical protein